MRGSCGEGTIGASVVRGSPRGLDVLFTNNGIEYGTMYMKCKLFGHASLASSQQQSMHSMHSVRTRMAPGATPTIDQAQQASCQDGRLRYFVTFSKVCRPTAGPARRNSRPRHTESWSERQKHFGKELQAPAPPIQIYQGKPWPCMQSVFSASLWQSRPDQRP